VTLQITEDRDALQLKFPPITAVSGPDEPIRERRKHCTLVVKLSFPKGWSFTLVEATFQGRADLDKGTEGTLRSSYSFVGALPSAALESTIEGPFKKHYKVKDTLDLQDAIWSPCGNKRPLIINTIVRVSDLHNRDADVIVLKQAELSLKWRRCH
jgi:hypothetical protein